MREHFVDDQGLARHHDCRVRRAWRRRQEQSVGRGTVRLPAHRNVAGLRPIDDAVDERAVGGDQADEALARAELEVDVVRAEVGVAISGEHQKAAARDKGQGGDVVLSRGSHRIIGKEQVAQRHWERVGVKQLDEVVRIGRKAAGQPFVDLQRPRVPSARRDVGRAKGGLAQPPRTVGHPANGQVGQLHSEVDRIGGHPVGRRQEYFVAALFEGKAEVITRRADFAVGVKHEVLARGDARVRRERELERIVCFVRHAVAGERHGAAARVVEFDQVGERAADRDRRVVTGEDLVQAHDGLHRVDDPRTRGGDVGGNARGGRINERVVLVETGVVLPDHIDGVRPLAETGEADGG